MNVLLQKLRLIFHNTKSFSVLGHFAFYIMTKKTARISSKLYSALFKEGGDKLIAVYSVLKTSRGGEVKYYAYTSKNRKFISGYSLLRAKTILTLHTIEKYVPTLIDMGLCFIDKNGDFVLVGNQKLKKQYNNKLLPIKIGVNLTDTAYNSLAVRVFSMEKTQKTQIEKKQTRSEIIAYGSKRLSKYYETQLEPFRTIFTEADNEIEKATSFLCIGYGFNDVHVQPKLIAQIKSGKPIIVITKELTPKTKQSIIDANCKQYILIEEVNGKDTRVYSSSFSGELIIPDVNYWSLSEYLKLTRSAL